MNILQDTTKGYQNQTLPIKLVENFQNIICRFPPLYIKTCAKIQKKN